MPEWNSLFMRCKLDDSGSYPRNGLLPESPDRTKKKQNSLHKKRITYI